MLASCFSNAWVIDPSVQNIKGIAEFKCPYREAKLSLVEACQESEFCYVMVNDKLRMKESRAYYHQIQLQLYVASDYCSWCDFCVYTTKDIGVVQVYHDQNWVSNLCPHLDYLNHILPETLSQKIQAKLYIDIINVQHNHIIIIM